MLDFVTLLLVAFWVIGGLTVFPSWLSWTVGLVLGIFIYVVRPELPGNWNYIPKHAMRVAVRFAHAHNFRADSRRGWVGRYDNEKCYVFLSLPEIKGHSQPYSKLVLVVWSDSDQVDDLGIWHFDGTIVTYRDCIDGYEDSLRKKPRYPFFKGLP